MAQAENKVSLLTASSLVVAAMIGTGIFTSLGFQVVDLKSGFSIMLLWIVGGIVAFCGAATYAELGSAFPRSGGEYSLLSRLVHPALGFVAGWVSATVGFAAPASIAAIAFSSYLDALIPGIPPKHLAAAVLIIITILHMSSIRTGAWFQDISTIIKVGLIVLFVAAGLLVPNPVNIEVLPTTHSWGEIFSGAFAVSLVFVSYAYTGWNSTIYIVGQIDEPRSLPKSLFLGTGIVMILYLLLNFIFLYTVPVTQLAGQIDVGYLSGQAIFGELGGQLMGALIAVLLLSTISAYVFLGPRIMQVMGEDFRALSWFSKVSKKGIPQNAFLFSTLLSLGFIYSSTFDQVVVYTAFLLILITTLTVGGVFILRTRFRHLKTDYRTWGYPFTPLLFLLLNSWILAYLLVDKFEESMVALGILGAGIVLYFATSKAESK